MRESILIFVYADCIQMCPILVCSNFLQIVSKSAFWFGFGVYVDFSLTIDSSKMVLFW